jgi:hypothetical protein
VAAAWAGAERRWLAVGGTPTTRAPAEGAGVAPIGDDLLTLAWAELLDELGARVTSRPWRPLVAVQFPTEVHQVWTVDLLGEDDRHASRPAGVTDPDDPLHLLGEARATTESPLQVDGHQGSSTLNELVDGSSLWIPVSLPTTQGNLQRYSPVSSP